MPTIEQELMKKGRIEGRKEGEIKGIIKGKRQVAEKLLAMGIPLDKIAAASDLTKKELEKLKPTQH